MEVIHAGLIVWLVGLNPAKSVLAQWIGGFNQTTTNQTNQQSGIEWINVLKLAVFHFGIINSIIQSNFSNLIQLIQANFLAWLISLIDWNEDWIRLNDAEIS